MRRRRKWRRRRGSSGWETRSASGPGAPPARSSESRGGARGSKTGGKRLSVPLSDLTAIRRKPAGKTPVSVPEPAGAAAGDPRHPPHGRGGDRGGRPRDRPGDHVGRRIPPRRPRPRDGEASRGTARFPAETSRRRLATGGQGRRRRRRRDGGRAQMRPECREWRVASHESGCRGPRGARPDSLLGTRNCAFTSDALRVVNRKSRVETPGVPGALRPATRDSERATVFFPRRKSFKWALAEAPGDERSKRSARMKIPECCEPRVTSCE